MKKIIAILMSMMLAVSMLAACGTKTEDAPEVTEAAVEANGIEGKYIAVAQMLADIWSYNIDISFELKKDGEAVWNNYGMELNETWEEQEDGNIKITSASGDKIVEPYAEQKDDKMYTFHGVKQ